MRFGVGNMRRGLGGAVLVVGLVAGCGSGGAGTSAPATQTSPTADKSESAGKGGVARGGTVGGAGSACELPVSFDVAERWKPDAVDSAATADAELAALLRQGYVTMVCELDAKPAGHLGFLRVWTGEPGNADARQVLEAFLKAEGDGVGETRFRTFRTGDLSGVEVEYRQTVEALDETKTERALAVVAPDGPVVLHLGGLDDEEHKDMLPAYELAKRTLRVTS
ncbi:lipoprotein [Streptomyces sp. NPDC018693]|uniref:lipoprotein n=1 Tax=unclassified Streptomyces TaxID=2593676 RepID=UPI0037931DF0